MVKISNLFKNFQRSLVEVLQPNQIGATIPTPIVGKQFVLSLLVNPPKVENIIRSSNGDGSISFDCVFNAIAIYRFPGGLQYNDLPTTGILDYSQYLTQHLSQGSVWVLEDNHWLLPPSKVWDGGKLDLDPIGYIESSTHGEVFSHETGDWLLHQTIECSVNINTAKIPSPGEPLPTDLLPVEVTEINAQFGRLVIFEGSQPQPDTEKLLKTKFR